MAPVGKQDRQGRTLVTSFTYRDEPETAKYLKLVDELARKDSRSRSWIILEALKEYVNNHYPGNPQEDLRIWMGQEGPKGSVWARARLKEILKK
jgi:hypothetical protein